MSGIPTTGYAVSETQNDEFTLTFSPNPKWLVNGGVQVIWNFDLTVYDTAGPFSCALSAQVFLEASADGSTWFTQGQVTNPIFDFSETVTAQAAGLSSSCQGSCLPGPSFFRLRVVLDIASTGGLFFFIPTNFNQFPL